MNTQFESVRNSVQAIRAWGSLEKGFVQVCLSLDAGPSHRPKVELDVDDIADVMFDSDVWIGDIYYLSRDRWFSQFGIIKSLTGLTNKTIGGYIEHLDKAGQLFETEMSSSWEECIVDNGKIICPMEDEEPEEFIIENTCEPGGMKGISLESSEKVPETWEPKDKEKFNEWMDNVIRIIGEVADASPEELEKLGENIKQIGKELKDDLELSDELWEDDEEEVIETPVKPDESPIANKIAQEATEKIYETKLIPKKPKPESAPSENDWEELKELKELEEKLEYTPPSKSWGPNRDAVSPGKQEMSNQEIAKGRKRQEDFLDRILDEIVFCEPMSPAELQKKWENAWKDINKEWQRRAMKRRHKEQEESSRRDLFNGLSGKTPLWPMLNPRDPEF